VKKNFLEENSSISSKTRILKVPKKFFVLSKVEPGSKCSASQKRLRSFQVKRLGRLPSLAKQEAKSSLSCRRVRKTLTPSIFDREADAKAVQVLASRLFKAEKIHSEVIKPENISSYETGTQIREKLCPPGGSLVKPMSLEMSFMEEIQSLHMEGMGETGPQMEIPLQTPVVEVTHREGVKNLLPKPTGKKRLVKNINPSNLEFRALPDHNYWNDLTQQTNGLTETDQSLGELFPQLIQFGAPLDEPMIENQVHNQAITGSNPQIDIQNLIAENSNTVEEIIVPVVTAKPNSKQYVIIKEVKKEEIPITNNETMSVNDEWSQNSLFPELNVQFPEHHIQDEDLDLTAHNPNEVTGQAFSEEIKPEVDENPFTSGEGEMDLLATLMDDTIDVNSEAFQNFVKVPEQELEPTSTVNIADIMGPSTSTAYYPTSGGTVEVKEEPMEVKPELIESPVKRGRGRPRVPRVVVEPARRPRGRPPSTPMYARVGRLDYESSSAMSSEEQKDYRYKRMRELNNAASKRCRINRKRKFQDMEEEQTLEAARNIELKNKVAELEDQVSKFKTAIFDMIKKRKTEQVQARTEQVQTRPEQVLTRPEHVQSSHEQVQTSSEQVQTSLPPAAATSSHSFSTIDDSSLFSFDLDMYL